MPSVLESMKFGIKKYMEKGAFGALAELNNKSTFGKHNAAGDSLIMFFAVLVMLLAFGLGFIAVSKLSPGKDDRSKNIRLGLYAILLLTEGRVGLFYAILWLLQIQFS